MCNLSDSIFGVKEKKVAATEERGEVLMKLKFFRRIIPMIVFLLEVVPAVFSGGLSTQFGEVVLENLKIGQTYNTRELFNLPLKLVNTSDYETQIHINPYIPKKESLRRGFEAIPDISWIRVMDDVLTAAAGGNVATDVIITIPDDEKYLGKKYQAGIISVAAGKGYLSVGIDSRILITVDKIKGDISEEKQLKLLSNANYSVTPPKFIISNLKLGKKQSIEKLKGKPFKIINPNEEAFTYKISSVDTKSTISQHDLEGYEDCPDPKFLKFEKDKIKVMGDSIEKINCYIEIPDKPEYRGKRYLFIINTEVMDQEIPLSSQNRIYLETEK